MSSDVTW